MAAARPYLLVKGLLMILIYDVWVTRLSYSVVHYHDSQGFRSAHFDWMNALLPAISSSIMVWSLVLIGWMGLFLLLFELRRWALTLLFLIYTFSWTSTRLDLFQHHYFISILLFGLIFFPILPGIRLYTYRNKNPELIAWAYRMVVVMAAIVYVFTAIAKMDTQWLSGSTLKIIDDTNSLVVFFGWLPQLMGHGNFAIYVVAAWLAIAIEMILALSLILALGRDNHRGKRSFWLFIGIWLVAVALHLGIELMGMSIGLFSCYMLLIVSVVLLPRRVIERFGVLVGELSYSSGFVFDGVNRFLSKRISMVALASIVLATLFGIGVGSLMDIPGWAAVSTSMAVGTGITGVILAFQRRMKLVLGLSSLVFAGYLFLSLAVIVQSVPARYAVFHAMDLARQDQTCDSLTWRNKATSDAAWYFSDELQGFIADYEWPSGECDSIETSE